MIEAIQNLTTVDKIMLFGFSMILITIAIVCVKSGLVVFQGKELKIGVADTLDISPQRTKKLKILRAQFEYLDRKAAYAENLIHKLYPSELDKWYIKCLINTFKETVINWIVFERLRKDKAFIQAKQKAMVTIIKSMTDESLSLTNMLSNVIEKQVEDVILDLLDIEKVTKS